MPGTVLGALYRVFQVAGSAVPVALCGFMCVSIHTAGGAGLRQIFTAGSLFIILDHKLTREKSIKGLTG